MCFYYLRKDSSDFRKRPVLHIQCVHWVGEMEGRNVVPCSLQIFSLFGQFYSTSPATFSKGQALSRRSLWELQMSFLCLFLGSTQYRFQCTASGLLILLLLNGASESLFKPASQPAKPIPWLTYRQTPRWRSNGDWGVLVLVLGGGWVCVWGWGGGVTLPDRTEMGTPSPSLVNARCGRDGAKWKKKIPSRLEPG